MAYDNYEYLLLAAEEQEKKGDMAAAKGNDEALKYYKRAKERYEQAIQQKPVNADQHFVKVAQLEQKMRDFVAHGKPSAPSKEEKEDKAQKDSATKKEEPKKPEKSDKEKDNEKPAGINYTALEEALQELDQLIGLKEVKDTVRTWINNVKVELEYKKRGMKSMPMTYHLIFDGNPGTGKTTVARIMAKIYRALGVLSKGHLVEVDARSLVAEYVGQTAKRTQDVIDKAQGGVLFLDEAYKLTNKGERDFGPEAVETLLKPLDEDRSDFIVIAAGYKKDMDGFLASNAGLPSRFKTRIFFPDYKPEEMEGIFQLFCKNNGYILESTAQAKVNVYLSEFYKNRGKDFGNGRDVRNFFENVLLLQRGRLNAISNGDLSMLSDEELKTIKEEDVPDYKKR